MEESVGFQIKGGISMMVDRDKGVDDPSITKI